jgi:hypothetical protein
MPGYSGTPLPKKLGIRTGHRAFFLGAPGEVFTELKEALKQCEILEERKAPLDFAMIFSMSRGQLEKEFGPTAKMLGPAGILWVSWPKKSSGVESDLNENIVREVGLKTGLVDVKVCAVTEIWSGLKFVRRVKDR